MKIDTKLPLTWILGCGAMIVCQTVFLVFAGSTWVATRDARISALETAMKANAEYLAQNTEYRLQQVQWTARQDEKLTTMVSSLDDIRQTNQKLLDVALKK